MRIARSRSLLSMLAVAPVATGCFLSGDYEVTDETVTIGVPDTTEDDTWTQDEPTGEATPPPPVQPSPEPPAATITPTSEPNASSSVVTSTTGAPSSAPSTEAPESTADVGSTIGASSDVGTGGGETSGWTNSDDGWWRDSSDCDRQGPGPGNCRQGCAAGEEQDPQGRCYWFNAGQGTWNQAKTVCANHGEGWFPITIHDEDTDEFVSSRLNRIGETWLGAQYSMGKWRWIDDETVFWNGTGPAGSAIAGVFAKWGTNEPSGSPGENCGRVESFNNDMRWGDSECGEIKLIACQGPPPAQ